MGHNLVAIFGLLAGCGTTLCLERHTVQAHLNLPLMSIDNTSLMANANVEVANDFFHDAEDLLHRYRLTVDYFYAVKSKRMKLFLDLRMGAECILKAYAAYFLMAAAPRVEVIHRVESYKHNILRMADDVKLTVPAGEWQRFEPFVQQLSSLPVGLRYRLDGADFREMYEEFYYVTVGSDLWLDALHDATQGLTNALNTHLASHSRIISGADLWAAIKKPHHNKYAKKGRGAA